MKICRAQVFFMLEIHNVFESFYQYPGKFENHVTYWKN